MLKERRKKKKDTFRGKWKTHINKALNRVEKLGKCEEKKWKSFFSPSLFWEKDSDLFVYFCAECANSILHKKCLHFHLISPKKSKKKLKRSIFLKQTSSPAFCSTKKPSFSLHRLQSLRKFDLVIYCVIPPWNKNISKWWIYLLKNKIISFPCFNNYRSHYSLSQASMHLHWFWKCIHAVEIYDLCLR